jgi:ACS family pantothenate transporter-like MFS transporter
MYFTNYLDRSNLANAYVSGMKEELGFEGNQFNVINTVFTVGSVAILTFKKSQEDSKH